VTRISEALSSIDPAANVFLSDEETKKIWTHIGIQLSERNSILPRFRWYRSRRLIGSGTASHHVSYRMVMALVITIAVTSAVAFGIVSSGSTSRHPGALSAAGSTSMKELRGAVSLSGSFRGGQTSEVNMSAAYYVYSPSAELPMSTSKLPSIQVDDTVSDQQLTDLVAAVGLPTSGSWATSGAKSSYVVSPSSGWSLTVEDGASSLPSFVYQMSNASCDSGSSDTPIAAFDSSRATAWSGSFLSTLGDSSVSFSSPTDQVNESTCGGGSLWNFTRTVDIDGASSGTVFDFSYSAQMGTLLSVLGSFVEFGLDSELPLVSPYSGAQAFALQHNTANSTGSSVSNVSHDVNVVLTSVELQFSLYRLVSGSLMYVPTYIFGGVCSANQIYCSAYKFAESAVEPHSM
jgi:hypothetical protein